MNICETCIRRPVMTTLITASLIVLGIFGYRLLPVAALPAVDFPTIQISATLPGAQVGAWGSTVRLACAGATLNAVVPPAFSVEARVPAIP